MWRDGTLGNESKEAASLRLCLSKSTQYLAWAVLIDPQTHQPADAYTPVHRFPPVLSHP
jgi:hypothetical protein